jgi:hypothetical protein
MIPTKIATRIVMEWMTRRQFLTGPGIFLFAPLPN